MNLKQKLLVITKADELEKGDTEEFSIAIHEN